MADTETFYDVAVAVLETVANEQGWPYGCIWRLDEEQGLLVHEAELGSVTPGFHKASLRQKYELGMGLAGRCWELEDVVYIADLADSDCARATAARRAGVKSAVGIPLLDNGRFVGVVDFVDRGPRQPGPEQMVTFRRVMKMVADFTAEEMTAPAQPASTNASAQPVSAVPAVSAQELADLRGQLEAINSTQAVIDQDRYRCHSPWR